MRSFFSQVSELDLFNLLKLNSMRIFQLLTGLSVIVVIMGFSVHPSSEVAIYDLDDHKAVMEANAQFYTALNAIFAGDLEPMKEVWSHQDDVTYMGPVGGFQKGWDEVLANWTYQAQQNLGGEVVPEDIHLITGPKIAVIHDMEKGTNVVDGETQVVSLRATNVFRKEKGKWKMVGHHTDLLPYLQE